MGARGGPGTRPEGLAGGCACGVLGEELATWGRCRRPRPGEGLLSGAPARAFQLRVRFRRCWCLQDGATEPENPLKPSASLLLGRGPRRLLS